MQIFQRLLSLVRPLPQIKRGHFLVLHGEQGSGKSRLAQQIATKRGTYAVLHSQDLTDSFHIRSVLKEAPATIIVEAELITRKELEQLKALVTTETFSVLKPNSRERETIKAPQVIVCTQEVAPFAAMRRAQLHLVRRV